jgi:hypothetical protein
VVVAEAAQQSKADLAMFKYRLKLANRGSIRLCSVVFPELLP